MSRIKGVIRTSLKLGEAIKAHRRTHKLKTTEIATLAAMGDAWQAGMIYAST